MCFNRAAEKFIRQFSEPRKNSYDGLCTPNDFPLPSFLSVSSWLVSVTSIVSPTEGRFGTGVGTRQTKASHTTQGALVQWLSSCFSVAKMIDQKNIGCHWSSSVFFVQQPTGHWFLCQMGICHWSPSVAKTDEDQRQPMFFGLSFWLV